MIDVMNLCTSEIITYDTNDPVEAVKLAFLQHDRHNFNTSQYADILPTLRCADNGKHTVSCGNWAAFKDERRLPF